MNAEKHFKLVFVCFSTDLVVVVVFAAAASADDVGDDDDDSAGVCREHEEAMDVLQGDIDALEREKTELRERVKELSRKNLMEGIVRQSSAGESDLHQILSVDCMMGTASSP